MHNESTVGNGLFQVLKGSALALAVSFLFAVVFANVLALFPLPDKVIYPVNQTVKTLCIVIGTLAFVRGEKGFLKGMGIALLFTALSYLAFSAFGGDFSLSWLLILEIAVALVSGVASGAAAVNLFRA